MRWHPYHHVVFHSADDHGHLVRQAVTGPFLIAMVTNGFGPRQRSVYLDALVDTGATASGVPRWVIDDYRTSGIGLVRRFSRQVSSAVTGVMTSTEVYRLLLTVCGSPAPRGRFTDDYWRDHFASRTPLYDSKEFTASDESHGLEMVVVGRPYLIIGHDILASWVVLLDGPKQRFRVLSKPGQIVLSRGPRRAPSKQP